MFLTYFMFALSEVAYCQLSLNEHMVTTVVARMVQPLYCVSSVKKYFPSV